MLAPWMPVSICEDEEQSAYFHAPTKHKQCHKLLRPQDRQSLEDLIQVKVFLTLVHKHGLLPFKSMQFKIRIRIIQSLERFPVLIDNPF